jgi:hypothetical protein
MFLKGCFRSVETLQDQSHASAGQMCLRCHVLGTLSCTSLSANQLTSRVCSAEVHCQLPWVKRSRWTLWPTRNWAGPRVTFPGWTQTFPSASVCLSVASGAAVQTQPQCHCLGDPSYPPRKETEAQVFRTRKSGVYGRQVFKRTQVCLQGRPQSEKDK